MDLSAHLSYPLLLWYRLFARNTIIFNYVLNTVTNEFNGLSKGKDHWMYGLGNLDIYYTKKKKK